ncbi:MAG: hypothetical protein AB2693_33635, partial [Candidatus Thiodiazotropha sp.]
SLKSLPHYTFLKNKLVEGKVRNKHRPVNERKSDNTNAEIFLSRPTCEVISALRLTFEQQGWTALSHRAIMVSPNTLYPGQY